MKLQSKILIIIIPLVLLSLLGLGLWSFNEAKKSTYQSNYRYLRIVLESYTTETLHQNYQLLKEAKMDQVASYVESYKKDSINKAQNLATIRGGHLFVFNESGKLIFCTQNQDSANIESSWNKISKKIVTENSAEIIKGYLDRKPYDDVYVAQYFKPWGWVVFYSIPNEDVSVLVNRIRFITLGISLLCALASSFLIFIFCKKYLLRPIAKLKDAAQSIANHENIETISVNSTDELGLLARSMETMSKSINLYQTEQNKTETALIEKHEELQKSQLDLKRYQDSLEQLVEERTGELRKSEKKYHDLYDNAPDMFASVCGKTKTILECNETLANTLGYSKEKIIGGSIFDIYTPDSAEYAKEKVFPVFLKTGTIVEEELQLQRNDGSSLNVSLNVSAFRDESGNLLSSRSVWRDITERKKIEVQLLQAQKMESVGQLAGGVAHEINNPINGIMNYAQLIQDKIGEAPPLSEYTSEIIHETERVSKIVKNLLVFARQEKESHSPARMKDIINDTMSLIQTVLKRDQITLIADISEDLPKIKCRSQQIQQVVMNLITNARDALNEKYPGFDDNKKIELTSVFFEKDGRRWIRTTVEDRGLGIAPDTMERMFDPFYTTKERSEGTGLGLSISYGIVKDHHGELRVESEPGHYTRFHMDLPVDNGWDLPSSL